MTRLAIMGSGGAAAAASGRTRIAIKQKRGTRTFASLFMGLTVSSIVWGTTVPRAGENSSNGLPAERCQAAAAPAVPTPQRSDPGRERVALGPPAGLTTGPAGRRAYEYKYLREVRSSL